MTTSTTLKILKRHTQLLTEHLGFPVVKGPVLGRVAEYRVGTGPVRLLFEDQVARNLENPRTEYGWHGSCIEWERSQCCFGAQQRRVLLEKAES